MGKSPRLIVTLPDEDRAALTRIRERGGMTSDAEAIRALIRASDPDAKAREHTAALAAQSAKYERRDTGAGWGFNPKGRK
jgi:Arc/MetJ-type ribon-helix-helix transcriptional regulator